MRSAAILVGGTARRLGGRAKNTLEVGNQSILTRQLDALHAAGVSHVAMVGRTTQPPSGAIHPLADAVADAGSLGGLYTGLLAAPTERVLIIAGDLPFLTARFLHRLWQHSGPEVDVVVPRTAEGWHPLTAVYHRRVAARVKTRLDRRALRISELLDALVVDEVRADEVAGYDPDGVLLLNVNTPDDYDRACRHVGAHANDGARM